MRVALSNARSEDIAVTSTPPIAGTFTAASNFPHLTAAIYWQLPVSPSVVAGHGRAADQGDAEWRDKAKRFAIERNLRRQRNDLIMQTVTALFISGAMDE